jgi:amino acid transporter
MQTTAENDFFKKKYLNSVTYLVAILLFLLPFVEIKCNGQPFATNTGLGLALGTDYKMSGGLNSLNNTFGNDNAREKKESKEKGKMYVVALLALVLGVIGLIISFMTNRAGTLNLIIGILAAVALIILLIQLKMDLKDKSGTTTTDDFGSQVKVTADFTVWYYLSVISFLAAAFFGYKQTQPSRGTDTPPKNAPQVPLHNPGEQSEFPSSPDESELER